MSASLHARIEALADHDLVLEAVEAIVEAREHPGALVPWLEWLSTKVVDGALYRNDELLRRVHAILRGERREDEIIHRLFAPPPKAPGITRFPVALNRPDLPRGALIRIEVGGDGNRLPESDLTRALERARQAAFAYYREPRTESAPWRLLPEGLASICDGASVGLAAYAAFASHATGRALPSEIAFTGVLADVDDGIVLPERIADKIAALAKRRWMTTLSSPALPVGTELEGLTPAKVESRGALHAQHLELRRRTAPNMTAIGHDPRRAEIELAVLAVLSAWSGSLDLDAIDAALMAWPTDLARGIDVGTVVDALLAQRMVKRDGPTVALHTTVSSASQLRSAHAALGKLLETRADLDPDGTRRLFHLVRGKQREAALAHLATFAKPGSRAALLPVLRSLRTLLPSHERAEYDALTAALEASNDVEAVLVALALRCDESASIFARHADGLLSALLPVDDLLWVQGVTEAVLHVASARCLVTPGALDRKDRERLLGRPSIGVMEQAITKARASDGGAALAKICDGKLAEHWNAVLHHTGAWSELDRAGEVLDERIIALAGTANALLAAANGLDASPGAWVDAGLLTPDLLWFRGLFAGRARWFDFVARGYELADVDEGMTAASLERDPTTLARLAPRRSSPEPLRVDPGKPSVDVLPTPVARAAAKLGPSQPHLAVLSSADVAFASLLRLVAFAVVDPKRARAFKLPIKRTLLEAILESDDQSGLTAPFRDREGRTLALELVLLLERLEHCGGPLASFAREIEKAGALASAIVTHFTTSGHALVGDLDGQTWSLSGVHPRRMPKKEMAASVAWVGPDGRLRPLAGATLERGTQGPVLWLRREYRVKQEQRFTVDAWAVVHTPRVEER